MNALASLVSSTDAAASRLARFGVAAADAAAPASTAGPAPDAWIDVLALVLILIGAVLCLTAAIGLLRFPDVATRLHAATKPQVLGLILICLAIALSLRSWPTVAFLLPVVLIQLATAPLSAHMVGRQAYRNGSLEDRSLVVDELAESRRTPPASGG